MDTEIKHFSVATIRAAEKLRKEKIVDYCGNFYEVIQIKLFCEESVEVDVAEAVNCFATYEEAAAHAARANDRDMKFYADSAISCVYVVKSVNINSLEEKENTLTCRKCFNCDIGELDGHEIGYCTDCGWFLNESELDAARPQCYRE